MFSMKKLVLGGGKEGEGRETDLPREGWGDQGSEQHLLWVGGLQHSKEGSQRAELT